MFTSFHGGRPGGIAFSLEFLLALVLEFESHRGEIVNLFATKRERKKIATAEGALRGWAHFGAS